MWEHYRKTFWVMQTVIIGATLTILALSRLWPLAAIGFVVMQLSSAVGAIGVHRFRAQLQPCRLPPTRR
jgi:hypothetical protein